MKIDHRKTKAEKRKLRVRAKVQGTAERPRLHVFRSNKHMYLQVIDDAQGKTVAAVSSLRAKLTGNKTEQAKQITEQLVEKLKSNKVKKVVFDRGSYKYHGRVKIVAETMREQGVQV